MVVTIHHSKTEWSEVMEVQPFSPHLRMLLGTGFISITSHGCVRVDSTSLPHLGEGAELSAQVQLPSSGTVTIARSHVTQTGTILCSVGYESGQVKVFSVSVGLAWGGSEFSLSASLATELHQMSSQSEQITSMLMLPLSDGCEVHLCYNSSRLYKWSVKDITRSGSYQSRRDGSYSSAHPIHSLTGSALCLGSHDPTATENKMSELLVFGDDYVMKEGAGWPVEVVGCGTVGGEVTLYSRGSCKELLTEKGAWQVPGDSDTPVAKRRKLDQSDSSHGCLVTLSPNACCMAVARGSTVLLYHTGRLILGLKDSSVPVVPRCSRLLSLSLVSGHTPWDLAVTCSRLEQEQGVGFVDQVFDHFSGDFNNNSSQSRLLQQFYSTSALLHSSKADGLLAALSYRRMSRLNATTTLLSLCLPTFRDEERGAGEMIDDVCDENSSENKIEEIVNELDPKDFIIPQDVSAHLQGHCHWVVDLAIKLVAILAAAAAKDESKPVVPDDLSLRLLRQSLVLVYLWNRALPQPILPVTDGALSLLFKVLTVYLDSPSTPLSDELLKDISTNIPTILHLNLLSLSKAAQLQGFISGLTAAELPESFIRGKPCRIRPSVQSHYSSLDPYSPLTLVVPKGLSPPWRDCFLEGQKDIVHGGGLTKAVVQNTKLKQCSRCRSWTVSPEGLQSDQTSLSSSGLTSNPVQYWRSGWSNSCLCGAPWTLHNGSRT
ncbi:uncharacterized protein LOC135348605 isoform X2 [Halichondria panicea]|uniref:uncharacterized protein LOC135348605 isoform X2 n=1 Tax=Halichondria panicea TaxID=6063 RepID=UPI00312BAA02